MPTQLTGDPHPNDPASQPPRHTPRRLRRLILFWLGHAIGLGALAWFLLRVLPKPDRASYPCQRAAFPIASGFILWLTGLLGAGVAWKKARQLFAAAKYTPAIACAMLAAFFAIQWWNATPDNTTFAAPNASVTYALQSNHPIGTAQGIFPGRVTWVYDRTATSWDGISSGASKGWWGTADASGEIISSFTNQTVVNDMITKNLKWLSGAPDATSAWDALFKHFNKNHFGVARGYTPGEKIFIKTNWVTCSSSSLGSDRQYIHPSPEIIIALLTQLKAAGVNLSDVSMGDTIRVWPQHIYNRIHNAFPADAIKFIGAGSTSYQTASTQSTVPLYLGGIGNDRIPNCYASATYAINLAQMKTHARNGITLCAKNYFGSFGRTPSSGSYNAHRGLLSNSDGGSDTYGAYRVLVDLSGHPKLGNNTLLWIVDSLYTGYDWSWVSPPLEWRSAPFNDGNPATKDWPSSILMSLDPVAIDSVCLDLWKAEKAAVGSVPGGDPARPGVEDYLLQMARPNNDGTFSNTSYKPAGGTTPISSLGTFEHWSGNSSRKYSRNFGSGLGIELVTAQPAVLGRYLFYNGSAFDNNDPDSNAADDAAIAPDKIALLPGGKASFLNYSSYSKGINGIILDVATIPADQTPVPSDFDLALGNNNTPAGWTAAPEPAVSLRRGAGYLGSDRITLTWPDGTLKRTWLRVHLKPNPTKNLLEDVFYFGNAPGDTGNSASQIRVDAIDELIARADPHGFGSEATLDNPNDFNRDSYVDTNDEYVARVNQTYFETDLQLITVP